MYIQYSIRPIKVTNWHIRTIINIINIRRAFIMYIVFDCILPINYMAISYCLIISVHMIKKKSLIHSSYNQQFDFKNCYLLSLIVKNAKNANFNHLL